MSVHQPLGRPLRVFVIAATGLVMGFGLSRIGFSDWGEVHAMFTLSSWRLYLTFGGAVAFIGLFYFAVRSRTSFAPRPLHPGIVPGAILFGAGWALTGACPTVVMVQLGEGHMASLLTLAGMFGGMRLFRVVQARYLHWDTGSCEG